MAAVNAITLHPVITLSKAGSQQDSYYGAVSMAKEAALVVRLLAVAHNSLMPMSL